MYYICNIKGTSLKAPEALPDCISNAVLYLTTVQKVSYKLFDILHHTWAPHHCHWSSFTQGNDIMWVWCHGPIFAPLRRTQRCSDPVPIIGQAWHGILYKEWAWTAITPLLFPQTHRHPETRPTSTIICTNLLLEHKQSSEPLYVQQASFSLS